MSKISSDWFATWFDQDYLELYSKRDANEAKRQVSFLFSLAELRCKLNTLKILDVACGSGRHLNFIYEFVGSAYGIDLSKHLLSNCYDSVSKKLVQGDMRRLPFRSGSLGLLTSFFTSFGYFSSIEEELLVLGEFNRVLRPDGLVIFDLANKQYVVENLIPEATFQYSNGIAHTKKRIVYDDSRTRVVKSIELRKNDGEIIFHTEDVHLFDSKELYGILKQRGFTPIRTFGSFSGDPYSSSSERLVVLAKKEMEKGESHSK